jgi:thioredoxin 2
MAVMIDTLHVVCPHCHATNRVLCQRLASSPRCGSCRETLLPTYPIELNTAGFDRHLAADDLPLVVDFWAQWCAPCRMMAPVFTGAATQLKLKARLAKVDTEAEPDIAARFGIRSIPTLIAFSNGREIARQSGALDLQNLLAWIRTHVRNT